MQRRDGRREDMRRVVQGREDMSRVRQLCVGKYGGCAADMQGNLETKAEDYFESYHMWGQGNEACMGNNAGDCCKGKNRRLERGANLL